MFNFYKSYKKHIFYFSINFNDIVINLYKENIFLLKNFLLENLIKNKFLLKKFLYKNKIYYLNIYFSIQIIGNYISNFFLKKIFNLNNKLFIFKIFINLGYLNIPLFNILLKKKLNSNFIYIKIFIYNLFLIKYLIFLLKNYFYKISNFDYKKKNIFVFIKNIIIFHKNNTFILNKNIILVKKYNLYFNKKKNEKNLNKILYISFNDTILINKFLLNNLTKIYNLKILKIFIKKWLNLNIFSLNKIYKIILLFDLFGKIKYCILYDILEKKFLMIYFLKKKIKINLNSLLKIYFECSKLILFISFGSYLDYINNLLLLYNIKYNCKINILNLLNINNKNIIKLNIFFLIKNENFLLKFYKKKYIINNDLILYYLYNILIIIFFFNKIFFENDVFFFNNKIIYFLSLFIIKKYKYNLYWILFITHNQILKLHISSVKTNDIYNFFVKKIILILLKKYKKNIIFSILIYKPILLYLVFTKIKIIYFFIKKIFFLNLIEVNFRIYKLLKIFYKNKFFYKKFYFYDFYEKKIFYILNKVKFNSLYLFEISKFKLFIYNSLYIINYVNLFLNNIKINSKLKKIYLNRLILLLDIYKTINLVFFLLFLKDKYSLPSRLSS